MNDIIRMAREAGFVCARDESVLGGMLARFAALVRADEREQCAKVAEETVCDTHSPGIKIYGTRAAKAIRARSEA